MSKLRLWCVLGVLAASGVAFAEDRDPEMQGPPTKDPVRSGATVTLSFGPGEMHIVPDDTKETRVEGAAFSLRAGAALANGATLEALIDYVKGGGQQSSVFGASLKIYMKPALFVRPGVGIGLISLPGGMDGGTDRHYGAAALFGVGYEWFQLRDIALFGEFEMVGNRLSESGANTTIVNAQLNFGITWF